MSEFETFPKIPRLFKGNIVVTEKIDGTNAQILIEELPEADLERPLEEGEFATSPIKTDAGFVTYIVRAGSRNRWLAPGKDNFGFAHWVIENIDELAALLGPGRHYGEWWGKGIQSGYGQEYRFFSLFNTSLWYDPARPPAELTEDHSPVVGVPGLSVVPVLYHGPWFGRPADPVAEALRRLEYSGSTLNPHVPAEGVIVYHEASGQYFKAPFNDEYKGQQR
jgi:hypothetical protein